MEDQRAELEKFALEIFAVIEARDAARAITPARQAEITRLAREAAQRFKAGWPVPGCAFGSAAEAALWQRVFESGK